MKDEITNTLAQWFMLIVLFMFALFPTVLKAPESHSENITPVVQTCYYSRWLGYNICYNVPSDNREDLRLGR
jgi:hypothetical protein